MTHDEQVRAIEIDMQGKIHRRDWHGVADCAMDLRELDALERGRQEVKRDQERIATPVHPSATRVTHREGSVHLGGVRQMRQGGSKETLADLGSVSVDSPLG